MASVPRLHVVARKGLSLSSPGRPREQFEALFGRKPRLLDLFCCAGGAATGYNEAGFEIVGVDVKLQTNYPFAFVQSDALTLDPKFIATFDAIHASPPCQSYSDLAKRNGNADAWPRLIDPIRDLLVGSGLPYVIENVEGAPLRNPVMLCGTMFKGLRVLRHRLFEADFPILTPRHGTHPSPITGKLTIWLISFKLRAAATALLRQHVTLWEFPG
jgi:DNA (cytosine-5)-methyltransferase 1